MKSLHFANAGLAGFVLLLAGCVSIPPEAPELSAQLGKQLSSIEDANMTLLRRYFDRKREDVDKFIEEEWLPGFAENVFSEPVVAEAWNTIVKENNKTQNLKFLMRMGPKLQAKVNETRVRLIQPLDDLERRIEFKLRKEYDQAKAINNTITSFLLSASEITENRNRYLEMAGVTDEKLGKVIDKTDKAMSDLVGKTGSLEERMKAADRFVISVQKIIEDL